MTLTAGNRRAGGPTAGKGFVRRPYSSQPPVSSTSSPRPVPWRPPLSGCPGIGRAQLSGRAPDGPSGVTVCVAYVTGRPATEPLKTARPPGKDGRAPAAAPPPNSIGKGRGPAAPAFGPHPLAPTRRLRFEQFGFSPTNKCDYAMTSALPRQLKVSRGDAGPLNL